MAKDLYVSALLDVYGEFLSEKQRNLVSFYYDDDLSLGEISENEGITRQGARDLIKRAEQQLYRFEERCGYCKSFLRLKQLSKEAKEGNGESLNEMFSIIDNI